MSEQVEIKRRFLPGYKIHWHVVMTHFPVSFFIGSFGFMILHLFTQTSCFELAGFVTLVASFVFLLPATLTGWITWKNKYIGLRSKLFNTKISLPFAMLALSFLLVIYRSIFQLTYLDLVHNVWHVIYFGGIIVLAAGAVTEGYYGGRLNHR